MRYNKGFTLIELLIVVAIILIIGAIAIPNLMDSRMRANEGSAIDKLEKYVEAQHKFRQNGYGRIAENLAPGETGYTTDFRMLYYGAKNDPAAAGGVSQLELIAKDHADAFVASSLSGVGPGGKPYGERAPFNGYYFMEPAELPEGVSAREFFATDFAHVAVPDVANTTGDFMYFVGTDGQVWRRPLAKGVSHVESAAYPTPLVNPSGWELH